MSEHDHDAAGAHGFDGPRGSDPPIRVIELAGAPGAGKTVVLPLVQAACRAAGLEARSVVEAARPIAARTVLGKVATRLKEPSRRRALWLVFLVWSGFHTLKFAWQHPRLSARVLLSQRRRPPSADARRRRVLYWFFRLTGTYDFICAHSRDNEVLILDEGFVHRTVQLFASPTEVPGSLEIEAYLALVPRPDVVVHIDTPLEDCVRRVHDRGVWPHLAHRRSDEIDKYVANAHSAVQTTISCARKRGWHVLGIANGDGTDLSAVGADLAARVPSLGISGQAETSAGYRLTGLPAWKFPRPNRIWAAAGARTRSPAVLPEVCLDVLGEYGLSLTREPANLPFGARNTHVLVETADGKKVLRRYREPWHIDTVRHEHSVLAELERVRFPAVRVARTSDGSTWVRRGDELYSLLEFVPGTSYSSCFMFRNGRRRLLDGAGRTLARLHACLADFETTEDHHLDVGLESGDGFDVEWYLEMLTRLQDLEPDGLSDTARRQVTELARQAGSISDRLGALHDTLGRADLPRVMIHGDFGIHNLVFARDGTVSVMDFELARRAWRVIDVVIVLSRTSAERGMAFLRGYLAENRLNGDEFNHWSRVWEYYHLTGTVRSWSNYISLGGTERLSAALDRFARAGEPAALEGLAWL